MSLSAAGTRGFTYLGMLDALEDHYGTERYTRWVETLEGVAGASAGALAGLVIALGLDRKQRAQILTDMSDARKVFEPNVALLTRGFGLEDGAGFRDCICRILMMGGLSPACTLHDFGRFLRKEFVCQATKLPQGEPYELSCRSTPHVRVVDAVFASCCVPFLFHPTVIHGVMLVDGALSCDYPESFENDATLFVRMDGEISDEAKVESWREFLMAVVRCSCVAQNSRWDRIVSEHTDRAINIVPLGDAKGLDSVDLEHDEGRSRSLHHAGYVCTIDHLHGKRLSDAAGTVAVDVAKLLTRNEACECLYE